MKIILTGIKELALFLGVSFLLVVIGMCILSPWFAVIILAGGSILLGTCVAIFSIIFYVYFLWISKFNRKH